MDNQYYKEMLSNFEKLFSENLIQQKKVYVFGHCHATECLLDLLIDKECVIGAILDNNIAKQGNTYRNIQIVSPETILSEDENEAIVCIVARAYDAMKEQLRNMGFVGAIYKLVDYNSFAEYSLTRDTIYKRQERVNEGIIVNREIESKYPGHYKIFCPFSALGDVFFAMSYLPYYLKEHSIDKFVVCVVGNACVQVANLFGTSDVIKLSQKDMDSAIQACLYTENKNYFIAHQDRPYVVDLSSALYIKCIPLEILYKCGVFGLPLNTKPVKPTMWKEYLELDKIREGKAVILSPYAKSVTSLPIELWENIIKKYSEKGYQCFTNVVGDEKPLQGTMPISPLIGEMKSVVEYAGIFIGIRSGLCDVIKYADCKKIALYPDYNYCDTKWKAIDMYSLEGWQNIVV